MDPLNPTPQTAPRRGERRAWNRAFRQLELAQWAPAEDVVRFGARHLYRRVAPDELRLRRRLDRVLDLGCGVGRHVVFFARLGLRVSGVDVSNRALAACQQWLRQERLRAELALAHVNRLPLPGARFDAVVSHGVLDQMTHATALQAMAELRRVLVPGGLVHLNLRAPESFDFGKGPELEPGTYLLCEGHEKGLPQHFWTQAELERLLADFEILDWERTVRWLDREGRQQDTRWAVSARMR